MPKKFQKHAETFTCQQCGTEIVGGGYTNHCTECFTSKHVDINPGDRLATCNGLMPAVEILFEHSQWILIQRCNTCGHVRKNKVQAKDNMEALAELQKRLNEKKIKQLR